MQEKTEPNSEFSDRTEKLAAHLNLKLSRLPEKLGVSPAMFFAYRTGKNRISDKAWKKLQDAEVAAGILINKGFGGHYGATEDRGHTARQTAEYLRAEAQHHLEIAQNLLTAAILIERNESE